MRLVPIGVFPRDLWLEFLEVPAAPSEEEQRQRLEMVQAAIDRYNAAGLPPNPRWLAEISHFTTP